MAISTIGVSQNKPNIELDSMFVNNPELTLYAINNSYESARLFQKEIELNERLDAYRKKKHNHQKCLCFCLHKTIFQINCRSRFHKEGW